MVSQQILCGAASTCGATNDSTRCQNIQVRLVVTHLLALPVGQVTLTQHEATGADVHLTPRTDQPHVLLHTQKTGEIH